MAPLLLLLAQGLLAGVGLAGVAYWLVALPPTEPRGIPAIPFWVALLPLFRDVDQQDLFRRHVDAPLRRHGAVKLFFGCRWTVLVHAPAYVADLFRHEDHFRKSGNNERSPGSVLASLLGSNVIASHGAAWRLYRGVVQPGLQRDVALPPLLANARRLRRLLLLEAQQAGVPMQELVQRYTIANFGQVFYGVDLGALESAAAPISQLQKAIKREIFKPVFLNFPLLDSLGLPSRERARRLATRFKDELVRAVERGAAEEKGGLLAPGAGTLLSSLLDARRSGLLTETQFRDNVTVLFIAGQENPQLAIISTMYLLAKHPEIQERLHDEVAAAEKPDPDEAALQRMPLLTAVVLESLRLLPPISQLINRRAGGPPAPLLLGGRLAVPPRTYVGYSCYSTNRDPAAWGADADEFRPARWGAAAADIRRECRRRRARAEFISFHGGRRACLGERFAMLQVRATLFVLAGALRWRLDPAWPERMTPAGPLYPRELRLVFESRDGGV